MPKYKVDVVQVYRAVRIITVEIEGPDALAAVTAQQELAAPAFDDPAWTTFWEIQGETAALHDMRDFHNFVAGMREDTHRSTPRERTPPG